MTAFLEISSKIWLKGISLESLDSEFKLVKNLRMMSFSRQMTKHQFKNTRKQCLKAFITSFFVESF